jgi:hypothetical protein
MNERVPALVESVVSAYLEAVDAEAPGLVEGLYLTGSTALGDFRPRTSDIDFVAVTANRLDVPAIAALERAQAKLRNRCPRPYFDGLYVNWDDLANNPAQTGQLPTSYEGRFHASKHRGDPVPWHTVAHHGIACRGPQQADLNIWAEPEGLAVWTLNNLESYWHPLLDSTSRFPNRWSIISLTSWGAVWIVLGISRLHYTLATGDICSKKAAGRYALQTFPEKWHGVIKEALRIRQADRARADFVSALADIRPASLARRRDAVAFGYMVIADAQRRYGRDKAQWLARAVNPAG